MSQTEWMENYGLVLDDARAAADWSWSPEGDLAQALRLTTLLLPLGYQFALVDEMDARVERAIVHAPEAVPRQLLAEIRLNIAYSGLRPNRQTEWGAWRTPMARRPLAGHDWRFFRHGALASQSPAMMQPNGMTSSTTSARSKVSIWRRNAAAFL
jgi:hypothetical protein